MKKLSFRAHASSLVLPQALFAFHCFGFFSLGGPKMLHVFKNRDFGGFRASNHGESIGLAESYSKMGINFSGDE